VSEGIGVSDRKADKSADSGAEKQADLKAQRLADALRANLKRRKSQSRDRTPPDAADQQGQD